MNKVVLIGRLVKDPTITYNGDLCIAKYTLAVDRTFKRDGENGADFIRCTAFGRAGEFVEKYLTKGLKIAVTDARIQTGKYEDKNGNTVYTTDVIVEHQEFVEPKANVNTTPQAEPKEQPKDDDNEFYDVDENELPF